MKKIKYLLAFSLIATLIVITYLNNNKSLERKEVESESKSGAGEAMDFSMLSHTYPDGRYHTDLWYQAWEQLKNTPKLRDGEMAEWKSIGPENIGGRTLCLAFHPDNTNIIYVGSASGGLWKTSSAGVGENAWKQVSTGFPILGVGAIAIDQANPDIMYLGTGEVYRYQDVGTGFTFRTNRGSYGIGILKTTDGGNTWTKSLDWAYTELKGIQKIVINPLNSNCIYAATTEGLYRSYDAGATWANIKNTLMAVDIEINPQDTNRIFVTFGCYNNVNNGIYRSTDAGNTFTELTLGLPSNYTGKTLIDICKNNPNIMYASVADNFVGLGLFKSTNGGDTWLKVNDEDVPKYQGWYAHDVAVNPLNPQTVVYGGIDVFKSINSGDSLYRKSYWYNDFGGQVPIGGPEGTPDYVHADVHAIYYHPTDTNKVFFVTDGGIFVSEDGADTFEGRNGGYQTSQFYHHTSSSPFDSLFAIGGLQDNSTAVYTGTKAWSKEIGGDGMNTIIDPNNEQVLFASLYYMRIFRSDNKGQSFQEITPDPVNDELANFNSPFALDPTNSNRLYGAAERFYRSSDGGFSWDISPGSLIDDYNPALAMAISPFNSNHIWVSTSPNDHPPARVKKSIDGGNSWVNVSGLPNRLCMDIVFDKENQNIIYTVFGGFNTAHIYKTLDGGITWSALDEGLPNVPHNSLVIDPLNADILYVSNDLGVFLSMDAGATWQPYNDGLPEAVIAMSLSISPQNRKLRIATHGNGVYEGNMVSPTVAVHNLNENLVTNVFPNPTNSITELSYHVPTDAIVEINIFNLNGQLIKNVLKQQQKQGTYKQKMDLSNLPIGVYLCQIKLNLNEKVIIKTLKILKNK